MTLPSVCVFLWEKGRNGTTKPVYKESNRETTWEGTNRRILRDPDLKASKKRRPQLYLP